jgi:feruloyl-CoA synthase
MLLWPSLVAAKEICGSASPDEVVRHPKMIEATRAKFAAHNKANSGSSTRIKRVLLMAEPPSVDGHEITDKGYVNQRATMERRKVLVEKLYEKTAPPEVIEIG